MNNNEEKLGMILGEPFEAFVNAAPISVMIVSGYGKYFQPAKTRRNLRPNSRIAIYPSVIILDSCQFDE